MTELLCLEPSDLAVLLKPSVSTSATESDLVDEIVALQDAIVAHLHVECAEQSALRQPAFVSLLDHGLDAALGGGISIGHLTEITGER